MKKIAADRNYRMLKRAQSYLDEELEQRLATGRRRIQVAFDDINEFFDTMEDPVVGIAWTGTHKVEITLEENPR